MFTGIIQDIGKIEKLSNGLFKISTSLDLSDCKAGSSISCNGVCLTAINIYKNNDEFNFEVNIGEETLTRTNLEKYYSNYVYINIEKSLKIGDEIGGHFVYGHVDAVTSLINIFNLDNSWEYHFKKNFGKNNKFVAEKMYFKTISRSMTNSIVICLWHIF